MSIETENRIVDRLTQRRKAGQGAFLPYLTAGLPSLDITARLLQRCDKAGCPAVELGIPFSDSIADGPVIQDSFNRALDAGFNVPDLLKTVSRIRPKLSLGLIAMVSMSIVARRGRENFLQALQEAGFDGVIIPDVPVGEDRPITDAAIARNLCPIQMIAPTTPAARVSEIARSAHGFIYMIAARGITGERSALADDLAANVAAVRKQASCSVIAGFGINTAEQVQSVCAHADGVIVGSAIVRRIVAEMDKKTSDNELIDRVGAYIDELARAANESHPEPIQDR